MSYSRTPEYEEEEETVMYDLESDVEIQRTSQAEEDSRIKW